MPTARRLLAQLQPQHSAPRQLRCMSNVNMKRRRALMLQSHACAQCEAVSLLFLRTQWPVAARQQQQIERQRTPGARQQRQLALRLYHTPPAQDS